MTGWQYRPGAVVYSSPHITITIDQHAGPAAARPAHRPNLAEALPGLSPFILWEWAPYRITVEPPLPDIALSIGDQPVPDVAPGVYLFRYENAVGASRIRLCGTLVPDLPVEVLSSRRSSPTTWASATGWWTRPYAAPARGGDGMGRRPVRAHAREGSAGAGAGQAGGAYEVCMRGEIEVKQCLRPAL